MSQRAPQPANAQEVEALCSRLQAFNHDASGIDFTETTLHLASPRADGELQAGLLADHLRRLAVNIRALWGAQQRGTGLGTAF